MNAQRRVVRVVTVAGDVGKDSHGSILFQFLTARVLRYPRFVEPLTRTARRSLVIRSTIHCLPLGDIHVSPTRN